MRSSWLVAVLLVSTVLSNADSSARAASKVPAIAAFDATFAGVNDYTYDLHSHEVQGSRTQERHYNFQFLRPSYAKSLVVDGDGKGGGAVWIGGSQVSAHSGGLLANARVKFDLNDPRVVSLRGYTTPAGLIQNFVRSYLDTPGVLGQSDGGTVGGVATDRIDLQIADPAKYDGATEQVLWFDSTTHWPVRQVVYAGTAVVIDDTFTDIKTNVGLKPSDFPF